MRFLALDLSLVIIEQLEPLVRTLRTRDRRLASHICDAASSVSLNLGEGSRRRGRDRTHLYRIAAGSAEEVRIALRVAVAWRHIDPKKTEAVLSDLDRLLAMLWGLTE